MSFRAATSPNAVNPKAGDKIARPTQIGLCATCHHARIIRSENKKGGASAPPL